MDSHCGWYEEWGHSTIASDVFTTRQRTVVPDPTTTATPTVLPYEISKYKQGGYGTWHYGPGVDVVKRLDLMPTTYSGASVTNTATAV